MSREEDLIRSTTHAIASTVREVPPLRLEPATGELRSPARAPRRPRSANGRQRRWWSWGAPLTAAAVVVALAIALVVIKDIPDGGAVSPSPTTGAGPGGAPRYYAAITTFSGSVQFVAGKEKVVAGKEKVVAGKEKDTVRDGIVVGDSVTGARIAKIEAPADVTFVSVTAAADDRTFVVFALTSSTGSLALPLKGATLTGRWYEVRIAPGTANPARLSPLPIKPQPWAAQDSSAPSPGKSTIRRCQRPARNSP
jgi:hypothetical protein